MLARSLISAGRFLSQAEPCDWTARGSSSFPVSGICTRIIRHQARSRWSCIWQMEWSARATWARTSCSFCPCAIAYEAPKLGLPVAGHVPLAVTIAEGAASGIKSIEHLSEFRVFRECAGKVQPYDAERCRPLFDRLAAKNVWQTPTLGFMRMLADVFSGKPMPHAEYASDSLLELTRKNIEASKLDEQTLSFLRSMSTTSLVV